MAAVVFTLGKNIKSDKVGQWPFFKNSCAKVEGGGFWNLNLRLLDPLKHQEVLIKLQDSCQLRTT